MDGRGRTLGGWVGGRSLPLRVDKREHAGGEGSGEATMSSLGDDVAPGGRAKGRGRSTTRRARRSREMVIYSAAAAAAAAEVTNSAVRSSLPSFR